MTKAIKPTKRIWPSVSEAIFRNASFQLLGKKNGIKPSMMNTRASAESRVSLTTSKSQSEYSLRDSERAQARLIFLPHFA